jgi:glutamate--cysteine ligase catalytic subunit
MKVVFLALLWLCYCYQCNSLAFLRAGRPLSLIQSKQHLHYVRLSGVNQFIQHYQRCTGLELPHFYWGDEIEYGIFRRNVKNNYDLSLTGAKVRESLAKLEKSSVYNDLPIGCQWQPEYGSWMIESVPKNPYGSYLSDLLNVEKSMQLRRKRLHGALDTNEIVPTLSNFPMLGVTNSEENNYGYEHNRKLHGEISNSQYLSDDLINPHPRFGALTRNIRQRKGSNVYITVPKDRNPFKVLNTSLSVDEILKENEEIREKTTTNRDDIHMDAMAFGMGYCCLQVTMQCRNEEESRYLHDQLAILAPVLQALSAASPIVKGHLALTDTRWNIISQAVDDRTLVENGTITHPSLITSQLQPLFAGLGVQRLQKSRYSTVSTFLGKPKDSKELENMRKLNDVSIDMNSESYQFLKEAGIDEILANHISHLFTRDPLVIFDDAIRLNDSDSMVSSPGSLCTVSVYFVSSRLSRNFCLGFPLLSSFFFFLFAGSF